MIIPKVSVVMSVYNDESYIREAVESILNQTFKDFEFIIINDGSTDRTRDILLLYTDKRIRLFDQENRGLTKSLNRGLSLAKGSYIARMDGNDISEPERFAEEVRLLEQNEKIGLVGTYAYRMDEQSQIVSLYTYKTTTEEIREDLWVDCSFCHSSVMFRKICAEEVGMYREKVGPSEDYDLWFRIAERFDVANLPMPLHKFRINSLGVTVARRFEQLRYIMLVRLLAEERKKYGRDSLELWSPEEIEAKLENFLPKTPENERTVLASNYVYLADVYYVTGDYRRSLTWIARFLWLKPVNLQGWKLFGKILISIILPKAILRHLRKGSTLSA
jgi:glycosyltransferase involved in cell wall biosynthesis